MIKIQCEFQAKLKLAKII